jgi:hypothetical protein
MEAVMTNSLATHNDLIFAFRSALDRGEFPGYDWEECFGGKFDQPIQMALRHRETLRVVLIDLNRDGTFGGLRQLHN